MKRGKCHNVINEVTRVSDRRMTYFNSSSRLFDVRQKPLMNVNCAHLQQQQQRQLLLLLLLQSTTICRPWLWGQTNDSRSSTYTLYSTCEVRWL